MEEKLHHHERVNSSRDIVKHDPGSFWQSLQLSDGRWFDDVEDSKKYKTSKKTFPRERNCHESDQLAGDFVDHDEAGILLRRRASNACSRGNAGQGDDYRDCDKN